MTVFDDVHADEAYHGLVQDVEGGYTRSIALLLPEGPAWPLPVYELALMTAERAESVGEEGLAVSLVTPEPAPLAALGEGASNAVRGLLDRARVRVYLTARMADGRFESEATTERAWPPEEKVVTEELGPFLRTLD